MYCGILILDKPVGLTSHDVVARVRRKLRTKKVGHAGTLDPDATGVLVLCIGDATRLLEYVAADDKIYEGSVIFGTSTDTDDASGEVLTEADASHLNEGQVTAVLGSLTGEIQQRPPRFSAVHVNGRRAYDLAREGAEFELPKRAVSVYQFSVLEFQAGVKASARFRVHCSKGTYIRSLCRDWGGVLGVPAHMSALRRVQSGAYSILESVPLETFEAAEHPGTFLRPMAEAIRHLDAFQVACQEADRLAQGQSIPAKRESIGVEGTQEATRFHDAANGVEATQDATRSHDHSTVAGNRSCTTLLPVRDGQRDGQLVAVFGPDNSLVAVAELQTKNAGLAGREGLMLKPKKVFWKGGSE